MFKLSRNFSIVSLIAFVIVTGVLAGFYRQVALKDLIELGEAKNVVLVQSFANSLWPDFAPFAASSKGIGTDALRAHPEVAKLNQKVLTQMAGLSVRKVKVYSLDGRTLFSTEARQIGEDKSTNLGFLAASSGEVASELQHRDSFSAFEGEISNRDLLSSYIPIRRGGPGTRVEGVFEVYDDVTPLLQRMQRTQMTVVGGVILLLAVLYGVLSLVVRRADRLIRNQYDEIKQVNKELAIARDKALEATKAKSEFLANMSHELRTPMNAIIGYSEMLIEDAVETGRKESVADLQKINSAGKHLLGLINDMLDLSKIEAGKMDLYLESFDIASVVSDVVATVKPLVEKNANTLQVNSSDGLGSMRADMTKVRQTLFNLLSNACKFTKTGTINLNANREESNGKAWIILKVADTGIGMTSEQMGKLFQAFSQADASTTRHYGGTGLGLAISKSFCQMMGGDITVESEVGRGSTFTVRLPAEVVKPETHVSPLPVEGKMPVTGTGAGRVLVIDDDPVVQDLLVRYLTKEGFQVKTARGGAEGLKMAKELKPDAITLDVLMPGMDGWAVLTALKADRDMATIPVIMVTIVDEKNLGFALGAAEYMTKPVDWSGLTATLKKYRRGHPHGSILVVEDDAATREILRHMLKKEGWAVDEAENGRVALDSVARNHPRLILLDLMMPEMDGFEFVAELRRHDEWKPIPIVVLTAKNLTEEDHRRLNGYAEKILQKGTYHREELLAEVTRLVNASVAHG